MIHNFSFKNVFKQLRKLGTGQNWTETKLYSGKKLHEVNFALGNRIARGDKLHKDSFTARVSFVRVTVMHDSKIKAEKKYIKKAERTKR